MTEAAAQDWSTVVLPPGGGERIGVGLGADILTVKAAGEQTCGSIAFVEYEAAPHSVGVRAHWHDAHEEAFYVVDGDLDIRVGDSLVRASAGAFAFVPRGIVHGFANSTARATRFVCAFTPAGFEEFFRAQVALLTQATPTQEELDVLALAHGVHRVPEINRGDTGA